LCSQERSAIWSAQISFQVFQVLLILQVNCHAKK
jgi:hypothetical protein